MTIPTTGEKIFVLTITAKGEIEQKGPYEVNSREHFKLSEHEFSMFGSRYSAEDLYPGGEPAGGVAPLSFYPTSLFIYSCPADLVEAKKSLRSRFIEVHEQALKDAELLAQTIRAVLEKVKK